MKERWLTDKQRRWLVAGIYIGLLVLGLLYYFLVRYTPFENPCEYYEKTGKLCGGCGTTRMMLSLMELNIPKAFSYNPVAFIILCIWNAIGIGAYMGKPRFITNPWFLSFCAMITILSLFLFTFFRSLY